MEKLPAIENHLFFGTNSNVSKERKVFLWFSLSSMKSVLGSLEWNFIRITKQSQIDWLCVSKVCAYCVVQDRWQNEQNYDIHTTYSTRCIIVCMENRMVLPHNRTLTFGFLDTVLVIFCYSAQNRIARLTCDMLLTLNLFTFSQV